MPQFVYTIRVRGADSRRCVGPRTPRVWGLSFLPSSAKVGMFDAAGLGAGVQRRVRGGRTAMATRCP
eukprot:4439356-Lingulodinium_polyedra.AAC.1